MGKLVLGAWPGGTAYADHLNAKLRDFVGRQQMMFVRTGERDEAHLRAGTPGFVRALDAWRLTWPEYGVEIKDGDRVGVLFVDLVQELVGIHVNGRASLVEPAAMRAAHPELGLVNERWAVVDVEGVIVQPSPQRYIRAQSRCVTT